MRYFLSSMVIAFLGADVNAQGCSTSQSGAIARIGWRARPIAVAVPAAATYAGPTMMPVVAAQRVRERIFGRLRGRCGG